MHERFRMNGWAVALFVALVAIVVGSVAYQFGMSQGLAQSGQAVGAAAPAYPPYPYGWHRPWGFGFFPFLFLLFWFVILRGAFWGGPWRHRWYYAGPHDLPPAFDEWHRRAHEKMNEPISK